MSVLRARSSRGSLATALAKAMIVVAIPLGIGRAHADDSALRSRIAALAEPAERAGASDLLEQAQRALLERDRLRGRGDEPAAARAEAIAEAAVRAAERRVAAHRARSERDAARRRLRDIEPRARIAHQALERARAEHERLVRQEAAAPPPEQAEAAPGGPP